MSYLVLARRFRPQSFDDIVGQEHVTRTLKNAIAADRVAHAFLFTGARGVGKTTAARVLAKALNCEKGPTTTPCGVCEQCRGIAESRAVDVQEIDGASNNSVEDVRTLRETVPYQPSSGRFKIFIVDEVHMLTPSAFNALLKTLEEPPPHVKFIFATTEPHKIPITILSRCQRYDFRLVPSAVILDRLASILATEGVPGEPAALSLLAREARGSMRDALSLLDRALAYSTDRLEADAVARLLGVADRQLLFDLSAALLAHDAAPALRAVDRATSFGCDLTRLAQDVLAHLRDLVVVAQCPGARELVDLPDEERALVTAQVEGHEVAELHRLFLLFSRAVEEIARSAQPRLALEMTLARLATLEPMRSLELLSRQLERLAAGAPAPGPAGAPPPRRGPGQPPPRTVPAIDHRRADAEPPRGPRATDASPVRAAAPRADEPLGLVPRLEPSAAAPPAAAPPGDDDAPPPHDDADEPSASVASASAQAAHWPRLLAAVRQASPALYHVLRFATPLSVAASGVVLRLPGEPFFENEAKSPQRRDAFTAVCRAYFGADVPVRIEVGGAETGGSTVERQHIESAAKAHDRRRDAEEHALVRAALVEFEGAKIAEIKLLDGHRR
jgi:DNA polymerase-3 subunit gamma/tau